jgi:hypothetical protein
MSQRAFVSVEFRCGVEHAYINVIVINSVFTEDFFQYEQRAAQYFKRQWFVKGRHPIQLLCLPHHSEHRPLPWPWQFHQLYCSSTTFLCLRSRRTEWIDLHQRTVERLRRDWEKSKFPSLETVRDHSEGWKGRRKVSAASSNEMMQFNWFFRWCDCQSRGRQKPYKSTYSWLTINQRRKGKCFMCNGSICLLLWFFHGAIISGN